MAGVIMVTSIPPFLGFTFFASLSGFIFGFPGGVLPAVIGKRRGRQGKKTRMKLIQCNLRCYGGRHDLFRVRIQSRV